IIGVDDLQTQALSMRLSSKGDRRVIQISSDYALGRGISAIDGRLYDSLLGKAVFAGDLRSATALPGRHNHQNAAAAFAACRVLGVDPRIIMNAILSFPGLPHRMELAGTLDGVKFINDSKATNAQAAEQALRAFPRVYWIAGGKPKSDGIGDLAPLFPKVAKAYLIGDAQDEFAKTLKGRAPVAKCGTLENAIHEALRDASTSDEPDPIILLSPACASFDQYRDFEARGDAFKEIVAGLTGESTLMERA
ncbi:MAG: cyanophycin synthetase, partial [Pseudomonadota bacterium]